MNLNIEYVKSLNPELNDEEAENVLKTLTYMHKKLFLPGGKTEQEHIDRLCNSYESCGFKAKVYKNSKNGDLYNSCIIYDDVNYMISNFYYDTILDIKNELNKMGDVVRDHHSLIKEIYNYCMALNIGNISVEFAYSYGFKSLFFNNDTDKICILFFKDLDLIDSDTRYDYEGNVAHVLNPMIKKNNKYFRNKLKIKNVNVLLA